jgi:septal ring factor EnvC (AmiA/AmiB activator)
MKKQNHITLFLVAVALFAITFSSGCPYLRKKQIRAELEKLSPQKETSERKLSEIGQKLETLKSSAEELEKNIKNRANWTLSYMGQHKLAIACMASVGYSIGDDNLFSDDINEIVNTATVLCIGSVIFFEDFRNEVIEVVGTLEKSDKAIKDWQAQLERTNKVIAEGVEIWEEEKAIYNDLSAQVEKLENELAELE